MSNLPKLLPPIKAYEGAPLQIRLDMYEGFVNPGVTAEVYFNKVKKYEVPGVYNAGLNRVTVDFTADQIKEMPLIADCRFRFGADQYPLRAQIKPTTDGSADGVVGYTVSLSGDSYTVIEMPAEALIGDLTAAVLKAMVTRINTFSGMIEECQPGVSRQFVVANDEEQEDTNVYYVWDGEILLYLGIAPAETQPNV